MQLYEVYAKCNHSVVEGALFQAHNPDYGLFDTDQCWGCADFFPMIVCTSFGYALTVNIPVSMSDPYLSSSTSKGSKISSSITSVS
jgi:hypothetical protein